MKNNLFITLIIAILTLLADACKKEPPVEQKPEEILFGTWNWSKTYKINHCSGYYHYLDSITEAKTYQLVFTENDFKLYRNDTLIRDQSIDYKSVSFPYGKGIVPSNDEIGLSYYMDNDTENPHYEMGTLKSMLFYDIIGTNGDCIEYREYFRKEF